MTDTLAAESGVALATSPTTTRGDPATLVSQDGTQALVLGTLTADADDEAVAEAMLDTFDGQDDVIVGGSAVVGLQLGSTVTEDLGRAELLAFPLLVVLSLIFFRGRAALIPLVVGVTTVLGTFLVLTGVNQVYGLSIFALNLVMGLGIGLAIDYTLFLVTRYREELAAQGPSVGAILTTMRTAGRTVAFSASTVAVALAALTVFPLGFIKSMGLAGATVAVVAAIAALVISPVMFGLWGAEARAQGVAPKRRARPLVPPLARRDAPSRHDRGRNRRRHARPRGAGAPGGVDPHRQLGDPDRPELADRRRHGRDGVRRHRRQPGDDRRHHEPGRRTRPRWRRTPTRSTPSPASPPPAPRSSSTRTRGSWT